MALVTIFFAFLIEIELWLYFSGFYTFMPILIYVQIALIILIAVATAIRRIIIEIRHRSSMH